MNNRWTRRVLVGAVIVNLFFAGLSVVIGRSWGTTAFALLMAALALGVLHTWRILDRNIRTNELIFDSLTAPRPEGVRVLRVDGTETPCELVYRGRTESDLHVWGIAGIIVGPEDHVLVDVLPGFTGIEWQGR